MNRTKSIHLALLAVMLSPMAANATLIFSDVTYAANSVTFTINGDMTGYATPYSSTQFSLQYRGDIWSGPRTHASNSWSNSPFDGCGNTYVGNTGFYYHSQTYAYTWSMLNCSLASAISTSRTVTLTFAGNFLDVNAANPLIKFYWGNGGHGGNPHNYSLTLLGEANFASVPEPGTLALLGLGLIGMAARRRKTV